MEGIRDGETWRPLSWKIPTYPPPISFADIYRVTAPPLTASLGPFVAFLIQSATAGSEVGRLVEQRPIRRRRPSRGARRHTRRVKAAARMRA